MERIPYLLVFLSITLLSSCGKSNNTIKKGITEQKEYNLSYGSVSPIRNKLDIYLPAGRNDSTPFLLLIHGGSWVSGDKAKMNGLQDSLLKRGIASASMRYRYASEQIHYQEMMQDVGAALHYCCSKSDTWHIRKDKYMIGGASAGAHMALLYAYAYDTEGKIAGVLSIAGPTDLSRVDWLNQAAKIGLLRKIEKMVGATYVMGQPLDAKFSDASPRYHIKNIPSLLLHGDADALIPYTQAQILATDLHNAGITNKLVTFQGAGHDLGISNPNYQQLLSEIEQWCKLYGR